MSVIEGVLLEEIKRMEDHISFYKKKLLELPKGTLSIQKINKQKYVYLKRKENGKVISKYVGKENSKEANNMKEKIKEYKEIKKYLKIKLSEYKKLKIVYKVYGKI